MTYTAEENARQILDYLIAAGFVQSAQAVVEPTAASGYRKMFLQSVTQADRGADFDFLQAAQMSGKVPRAPNPSIAGKPPE